MSLNFHTATPLLLERFRVKYYFFIAILLLSQFASASDFDSLRSKVHKITLDNGLRVIFAQNKVAPVFSAQVWVKVGGADELPGASGGAHLLEHMAFKGTESIGTTNYKKEKGLIDAYDSLYEKERVVKTEEGQKKLKELETELEKIWDIGAFTTQYQMRGASGLNAGTSKDYTVYTVSLPSSELEFFFSIESERLLKPVFRQFYKELDVVHEERRMRTDDDPSGKLYEALLATAYWDHPYGVPTIGWKHDLSNLIKADAEYLFDSYYRPDNIVISIVGDFELEDLKKTVEKYFGRLPKVKTLIPERRVFPSVQKGERRAKVLYDSEPEFMLGYHIPTSPDPVSLHFNLISGILDDGRSSIFQKTLVRDEQLMISVSSGEAPGNRYDPLFIVHGTPRSGVSIDKAANRIQSILEGLGKDDLITEEALAAVKKRMKLRILKSLQKNSGLARSLGINELLFGGWEIFFKELEELENVTVEDLRSTAKKFFTVENRTLVEIQRSAE